MKNCVYRFLNKENKIIYIGKAKNLKSRLSGHNHLSNKCYDETETIEYVSFNNENDMDLAERYFICKENPKYNTVLSDKPIDINMINLDILNWKIFSVEKIDKNKCKDNNKDIDENSKYISVELMELRAKKRMINEILDDGDITGQVFDGIWGKLEKVCDEIEQLEEKEIKKLIKSGINKGLAKVYIQYNTWNKEEIISDEIRKIEDEFYNKCYKEIKNNGYYKHEIYIEIDEEFICWNATGPKWILLLEGKEGGMNFKVKTHLKNKIVKQIISNIEKRLSNKFGELTRDIIILKNNKHWLSSWPDYDFMEFEKPYIIIKPLK